MEPSLTNQKMIHQFCTGEKIVQAVRVVMVMVWSVAIIWWQIPKNTSTLNNNSCAFRDSPAGDYVLEIEISDWVPYNVSSYWQFSDDYTLILLHLLLLTTNTFLYKYEEQLCKRISFSFLRLLLPSISYLCFTVTFCRILQNY